MKISRFTVVEQLEEYILIMIIIIIVAVVVVIIIVCKTVTKEEGK